MTIIFESILPVFLLVILGAWLKRWDRIDNNLWNGLEQLGFYVLFPALLFSTLAKADFAGMESGAVALSSIGAVTLMSAAICLSWPLFRKAGISGAAFTTVFQTSTRWNGFMALAIAEKLYGAQSLVLIALVMTLIIIPINFYNIGVLIWFAGGTRNFKSFAVKIVGNPLIISALLGILVNLSGIRLYAPLMQTIDLIAVTSLSFGLILVGAGLRIRDALKPSGLAMMPVVLKLVLMPLIMTGAALVLGMRGEALLTVALGASVPTAMNGYILAKQMGGDAPLYAAVATVQTALSFFTIPVVLLVTGYVAGG
ncbi:MAG: AEC family transporter [Shinella sp.]|nr:AEC family transporter [Shinella sp.]